MKKLKYITHIHTQFIKAVKSEEISQTVISAYDIDCVSLLRFYYIRSSFSLPNLQR